jgi:hypothetical protein
VNILQEFLSLVLSMTSRIEDGTSRIEAVSATFHAEADTLHKAAEAETTVDGFYRCLFESAIPAHAAFRGFSFLADAGSAETAKCRRLAAVCDELYVLSGTSLGVAFDNSLGWTALIRDRDRIAAKRRTAGQVAADQLVYQLTELTLMYPKCFASFLSGHATVISMGYPQDP